MKTILFAGELHGLKAYSGETLLGHVDEFYFDDRTWSVRYLVLDIGHRLKNRKVLISPAAIDGIKWQRGGIGIRATAEQIVQSPDASTDLPVARALEARIHRHYGWGVSWPESFMGSKDDSAGTEGKDYDPHLRSTRILTGTALVTDTGEAVGRIVDFAIDPESWRIESVMADFAGINRVLLDPKGLREIDVGRREIRIEVPAA